MRVEEQLNQFLDALLLRDPRYVERRVQLEDTAARAFYVEQSFDVQEGAETSLILTGLTANVLMQFWLLLTLKNKNN